MAEPDDGDMLIRRLVELNAAQNQQMFQILSMVALAVQIKNLSETDMSQAVIESKMASLLNQQKAFGFRVPTTTPAKE